VPALWSVHRFARPQGGRKTANAGAFAQELKICPASPDFLSFFAWLFSLFSFLFFISFLTKNALLFSQPMY